MPFLRTPPNTPPPPPKPKDDKNPRGANVKVDPKDQKEVWKGVTNDVVHTDSGSIDLQTRILLGRLVLLVAVVAVAALVVVAVAALVILVLVAKAQLLGVRLPYL